MFPSFPMYQCGLAMRVLIHTSEYLSIFATKQLCVLFRKTREIRYYKHHNSNFGLMCQGR